VKGKKKKIEEYGGGTVVKKEEICVTTPSWQKKKARLPEKKSLDGPMCKKDEKRTSGREYGEAALQDRAKTFGVRFNSCKRDSALFSQKGCEGSAPQALERVIRIKPK